MTALPLDEWRTLAEKATPGPWRVGRKVGRTLYDASDSGNLIGVMDRKEDAAAVAAGSTLVPALLARVEELEKAIYLVLLAGGACCVVCTEYLDLETDDDTCEPGCAGYALRKAFRAGKVEP